MASSCRIAVRPCQWPCGEANPSTLVGWHVSFFFLGVGGQQVGGVIGSFSALEKITALSRVCHAQEQGKFIVLFDSGTRTGNDVIEASQ